MNAVNIQSNDELRDLYRELILDHSRSPRHFGKLAEATERFSGTLFETKETINDLPAFISTSEPKRSS